jgi:hypothetical protein
MICRGRLGRLGRLNPLIAYARGCVWDYVEVPPQAPHAPHPTRIAVLTEDQPMDNTTTDRLSRNTNGRPPKLPLGPVYERINKHGQRYLVGRLGLMKLLVVPTDEISKGERVWQAFLAQGPYATDQQAALARELEKEF